MDEGLYPVNLRLYGLKGDDTGVVYARYTTQQLSKAIRDAVRFVEEHEPYGVELFEKKEDGREHNLAAYWRETGWDEPVLENRQAETCEVAEVQVPREVAEMMGRQNARAQVYSATDPEGRVILDAFTDEDGRMCAELFVPGEEMRFLSAVGYEPKTGSYEESRRWWDSATAYHAANPRLYEQTAYVVSERDVREAFEGEGVDKPTREEMKRCVDWVDDDIAVMAAHQLDAAARSIAMQHYQYRKYGKEDVPELGILDAHGHEVELTAYACRQPGGGQWEWGIMGEEGLYPRQEEPLIARGWTSSYLDVRRTIEEEAATIAEDMRKIAAGAPPDSLAYGFEEEKTTEKEWMDEHAAWAAAWDAADGKQTAGDNTKPPQADSLRIGEPFTVDKREGPSR